MSRRTRKPGPINLQTTMKQSREIIGRSEWISIDINDGSWTQNDPNSTLVSTSTAAAGMTISLESDRDGDDWTVSAQDCVRWFKPLTTPVGSLMKWDRRVWSRVPCSTYVHYGKRRELPGCLSLG
jgi:hypothetical protein